MFKKFNIWYVSSFVISFVVAIPILTVFTSFFEDTSNYFEILKQTFLVEYIINWRSFFNFYHWNGMCILGFFL